MSQLRVNAVLPYVTGLPRDVAINSFHFSTPDTDPAAEAAAIVNALDLFYNLNVGAEANVATYISEFVTRDTNGCRFDFFIDDINNQGLQGSVPWSLEGEPPNSTLPLEVSVCTSFVGANPGLVPVRRRRGRIYIGPLGGNAIEYNPDNPPEPATALVEILVGATERLASDSGLASAGVEWQVWSRANDAGYQVISGWVDNEFDTQRRREVDATVRTAWTIGV